MTTTEPTTRTLTVHHDGGVTLPVTRGGRGRPLVLVPGLSSTQADLRELAELLRRDHDVTTFDLRGHGLASTADRYTFAAFLGDLGAVLAELALPEPPVLVGYSLGADLAVHHAAEHPDAVAELVLVDGANPLPEPFLADVDLAWFRELAEEQATGPLTAEQIFDLGVEIDVVRSRVLDRYRRIDRPITLIMSTAIAGAGGEGRAPRHNRLWRAGVERLVRERPDVATHWLDADHRLAFTHAPEIARIVRRTLDRC